MSVTSKWEDTELSWTIHLQGTDRLRAEKLADILAYSDLTGGALARDLDDFACISMDYDLVQAMVSVLEGPLTSLGRWGYGMKESMLESLNEWLAKNSSGSSLRVVGGSVGADLLYGGFPQRSALDGSWTSEVEDGTFSLSIWVDTLEEAQAVLDFAVVGDFATSGVIVDPGLVKVDHFDWCTASELLDLLEGSQGSQEVMEVLKTFIDRLRLWVEAPHRQRSDCNE